MSQNIKDFQVLAIFQSRSLMHFAITADSIFELILVNITPFETRYVLCPALQLSVSFDTCLGLPYWITKSTAPTSIPSSILEVHTMHLISPS